MNKIIWFIGMFISLSVFGQDFKEIDQYIFDKNYEKAGELLGKQIMEGNSDFSTLNRMGVVSMKLYNYDIAYSNFEKALLLKPEDISILDNIAYCSRKLGDKKKSIYFLNKAYELDSANKQIAGEYADILISVGNYKKAANVYWSFLPPDTLIQTNRNYDLLNFPPDGHKFLFFYKQLAFCEYKMDRYGGAINHLKVVEHFAPSDKEALYWQALILQKLSKFDGAIEACDKILTLESDNTKALAKKAYILFGQKFYTPALEVYEKLIALEADNPDPTHLKNYGICLYYEGKHQKAMEVLDVVKPQDQLDPFVPFYLGLSCEKLAHHEKALENLQEAAFLSVPGYSSDVYHHLGIHYKQMRMFKEALGAFEMVQKLDPANYNVLFDIAITHEEYNRNQTLALNYYNEFVKQCTNSKSANLKYALNRIKRIKEDLFFEE